MPTGRPHAIKCRKCRRGMFGEPSTIRGVRRLPGTARGRYVGLVCLDCGHEWMSRNPTAAAHAFA